MNKEIHGLNLSIKLKKGNLLFLKGNLLDLYSLFIKTTQL